MRFVRIRIFKLSREFHPGKRRGKARKGGETLHHIYINASRRWTPTLEMNTNTRIAKNPWTTRRMDGRTYYTATQGILTGGLRPHALHAITGRTNNRKKVMRTTRQRDRETYKLDWTPLGSKGPQCGDKILLRAERSPPWTSYIQILGSEV